MMASSKELPTAFGPLVVTRFAGPGDTPCIQIGDDVRLARADVDALVEELIEWADDVDGGDVVAKVMALLHRDDDEEEGDIYSLADGSFRVSGDTPIERINEHFEVEIHPSDTEDEDSFETIGGLIAHEMGHVPTRNEFITLAGLNFVVMLTKGGAVRWFKVTPAAQAAS